jgi:hypothetical protein
LGQSHIPPGHRPRTRWQQGNQNVDAGVQVQVVLVVLAVLAVLAAGML